MSCGQEVGRELDPLEVEPERLGERLRHQGLAEPGEVLEEEVAVGDEADRRSRWTATSRPTTAVWTAARTAAIRSRACSPFTPRAAPSARLEPGGISNCRRCGAAVPRP